MMKRKPSAALLAGMRRPGRRRCRLLPHLAALLPALWLALAALASVPPAEAQEPVDVELVIAVDVSLSMSPEELLIQRDGYAAALRHDEVVNAILDGMHGRIGFVYFEWASSSTQRVIVPWTAIGSRADAERVADMLTAAPPSSARRTSISGAMSFAADLFAEGRFHGMRRVIDISGDGPNNQGAPVEAARDALVAKGIVINGLPLMTNGGLTSSFSIDDLDQYYSDCVIGGPGSFMVPVNDWSQFPEAVRRKLVVELAGVREPEQAQPRRPPVVRVADEGAFAPGEDGRFDCLIGEKIWDRRSYIWRDP